MARAYEALTLLIPGNGESHFRLGFARLFLGQFKQAIPAFTRASELDFMRPSATYNVACCHSRLGEIDAALSELRRALEQGFDNQALLKEDPDLANVRADPRYALLLKEWLEKRSGTGQKP